jgi:hypothetical protein
MRTILDTKSHNAIGSATVKSPASPNETGKKGVHGDQFVSTEPNAHRFSSSKYASQRYDVQRSFELMLSEKAPRHVEIWWKDLGALIDALPQAPARGSVPELDERSKEALRAMAKSAPHRQVVI